MPHHFDKNPTEFFSGVGAPYIRERHNETDPIRSQPFGLRSAVALVFCTVALGVMLSAASGFAKLVAVAQHIGK